MQTIFTYTSKGTALFKFDQQSTIEWLLQKATTRFAGLIESEFTIAMQADGLELERSLLIADVIIEHPVNITNSHYCY